MEEELSRVTEWLLNASSQVGAEYFQLPVAGKEEPEYRERVYCYELYHRWRCYWPESFQFSLSGEIDKQGHPLIRDAPKPDFLVHVPGRMINLLIVEVKAANAALVQMGDDLKKLTRFRRNLVEHEPSSNYYAAYFWLYGLPINDWPQFRNRLLREVEGSQDFDPGLVACFVHDRSGSPAIPVSWQ